MDRLEALYWALGYRVMLVADRPQAVPFDEAVALVRDLKAQTVRVRVHMRHRSACAPKRHFHVRASAPLCGCLSYSCGTDAGAATPLRSFRP